MSNLILKHDHPKLKEVAKVVPKDEDVLNTINTMFQALGESANGVGLAANQVGHLWRVILLGQMPMINPEIVHKSRKTRVGNEGCLSYPNVFLDVRRHMEVTVGYEDLTRVRQTLTVRGREARIVQHVMDFLDGKCLVGDEWRRRRDAPAVAAGDRKPKMEHKRRGKRKGRRR